jgi:hypothetical protein
LLNNCEWHSQKQQRLLHVVWQFAPNFKGMPGFKGGNVRFRVSGFIACAVLLVGTGVYASGQTANDSQVAGTFRIADVKELGQQQVQLSLQIRMVNESAGNIRLSNFAFHPSRPVPSARNSAMLRLQPVISTIELPSMTPTEISNNVLISRQEYLEYRHVRALHFKTTVQNQDGTTQTQMLTFLPEPFTRVK